ncbi:Uncharacterised protein [Mycobacteroides abscessus subsp. abscessus]|nr:Uncharacterised protein [Mycobacteroides abscessus subsp. abscessus]
MSVSPMPRAKPSRRRRSLTTMRTGGTPSGARRANASAMMSGISTSTWPGSSASAMTSTSAWMNSR